MNNEKIAGFGKDQVLYMAEDFDAPMELVESNMDTENSCTINVQGMGQAWGGIYPPPQPSRVCPGCGRCKDCGRPYEAQPPVPIYPTIGDPIYPYPGTTWIG